MRLYESVEYLDSPEMIGAYLEAALEDQANDPAFMALVISNVIRALRAQQGT